MQPDLEELLTASGLHEEDNVFDANYITKYALSNPQKFPHLFPEGQDANP